MLTAKVVLTFVQILEPGRGRNRRKLFQAAFLAPLGFAIARDSEAGIEKSVDGSFQKSGARDACGRRKVAG